MDNYSNCNWPHLYCSWDWLRCCLANKEKTENNKLCLIGRIFSAYFFSDFRYSLSLERSSSTVTTVSRGASVTSLIMPQGAIMALLPPLMLLLTLPTLTT